jgi:hypothetical protein
MIPLSWEGSHRRRADAAGTVSNPLLDTRRRAIVRLAVTMLAAAALLVPAGARSGEDAGLKPPTGLGVAGSTDTSVTLTWGPGRGRPATGFALSLDNEDVGWTAKTSYTFAGLACGRTYVLAVQAVDAAGNRSDPVSLFAAPDVCPPPPPAVPRPPAAPPPASAPSPPAGEEPLTSPGAPTTESPVAPAPPASDHGGRSGRAGWEGAGAFVWHENDAAPEALASELRENGFSWVAVLLHDGGTVDPVEAEWVSRFRGAAPELAVGGWGVLRDEPEEEAELAHRLVADHGVDFYIANAEAEYKLTNDDGRNAERFGRSQRFVAAFRALDPALPAALSSYCRADRQDLDWDAWRRAGFAFLPQAYVNDFGSAASPAACAAAATGFFRADAVHPTVGTYRGQKGPLSPEHHATLLEEAGTVGFSVYLAETRMDAHAWRVLGDAIATLGIARTEPHVATRRMTS